MCFLRILTNQKWRVNISINATNSFFLSLFIFISKNQLLKTVTFKIFSTQNVNEEHLSEMIKQQNVETKDRWLIFCSRMHLISVSIPKIFVRISKNGTFWQSRNKRKHMKTSICRDSQKPGDEKIAARPEAKERIAYITPDNPALQGQGHHPDLLTKHTHTHVGCLCSHPNNVIFLGAEPGTFSRITAGWLTAA